jgi:hypothetical protein
VDPVNWEDAVPVASVFGLLFESIDSIFNLPGNFRSWPELSGFSIGFRTVVAFGGDAGCVAGSGLTVVGAGVLSGAACAAPAQNKAATSQKCFMGVSLLPQASKVGRANEMLGSARSTLEPRSAPPWTNGGDDVIARET